MDNGCSAPTKTDNGIMRFGAQDNGIMRFGAQDNGIMRFGAQDNGIMKVPISHARTLPPRAHYMVQQLLLRTVKMCRLLSLSTIDIRWVP
jgi:hypothetical protein